MDDGSRGRGVAIALVACGRERGPARGYTLCVETPDGVLIRAARKGDRDAANELAARHWDDAWRAAYAITGRAELADDATQDAFERALTHLSRMDERRPFRPWLHRIVVNRTLDLLRAERRRATVELTEDVEGPVDHDEYAAFITLVGRLPLDRRVPLVLRYLLEYTPAEIAELTDTPVGTVSSRLSRGLSDLRSTLGSRR